MSTANLLISDFALILMGFLLRRYGGFAAEFWSNLERFVYYVLFPALLFGALAGTRWQFTTASALIETGLIFLGSGHAAGLRGAVLLLPATGQFRIRVSMRVPLQFVHRLRYLGELVRP